ncbi:MAG: nucleoside deaminase [Candidatus Kerfeldbacteria bacterium]|nr:nucleoside deaminase [Candidatus Kerfeldbacteria bacterium]
MNTIGTDEKFMEIALRQGKGALAESTLPVGCVIVIDGKVLVEIKKSIASHFRMDHAEMLALRIVTQERQAPTHAMTLYTTLEPCVMCFGAMLNSHMSRVVFALEDPFGGGTRLSSAALPPRHQNRLPEIVPGVLRGTSLDLFKQFFSATDDPYWSAHPENPLYQLCMNALT